MPIPKGEMVASRIVFALAVCCCLLRHGVHSQDYDRTEIINELREVQSDYTRLILEQESGVLAQVVRIPNSVFFTRSSCQVLYVGAPDWTAGSLTVEFVNGARTRRNPDGSVCTARAFFSYVDGANQRPSGVSGLGIRAVDVPWGVFAVMDPKVAKKGLAAWRNGTNTTEDFNSPPPPAQRKQDGIPIKLERTSYKSRLDNLRNHPSRLASTLDRESNLYPRPGGALSRPVLAASWDQRQPATQDLTQLVGDFETTIDNNFTILEEMIYNPDFDFPAKYLPGTARVYSAPVEDCRAGLQRNMQRGGGGVNLGRDVGPNQESTNTQKSCYVTQWVVYLYNDCIDPPVASNSSSNGGGSAGNGTAEGEEPVAEESYFINCNPDGLYLLCGTRVVLDAITDFLGFKKEEGFVHVAFVYDTYDQCYPQPIQVFSKMYFQVIIYACVGLGCFLFIVGYPTLWRIFVTFPISCFMFIGRAIKAKRTRDPALPPLEFDRFFQPMGCMRHNRFISKLCWLRKQLVYAIATVHSGNGQYRALQVAVVTVNVLYICIMAFPPNVAPVLDYYVPPIIVQLLRANIRINRRLNSALKFGEVIIISTFIGTLGYLSLLANFNSPKNKYYKVQCVLSVFFMLILDFVVVMQLAGILYYWRQMAPSLTYLPMVIFQLGNLVVANILQVMLLFSRSERHDEARRKEYEEYIRAMEEIAAKKQKQKDVASEDDQELPATPVHRIKAAAASDASATANRMATATSATPFLLDANVKTSSVANLQSTVDVRGNAGSPGDEVAKGKGKGGGVKVHAAAENKLRKRVGQSGEAEVEGKQQREERDHAIVELGDVAVDMSLEAGSVAGSSGKGSGKGSKDGDDEEEEEPKKPLLKRMHNLVREDAAFKYPAWFLAAVLIAIYMVIFTYGRALYWSDKVGDCLGDPTECFNNVAGQYVLFSSRYLTREGQSALLDDMRAALDTQEGAVGGLSELFAVVNNGSLSDALQADIADQVYLANSTLDAAATTVDTALEAVAAKLVEAGFDISELPPSFAETLHNELVPMVVEKLNAQVAMATTRVAEVFQSLNISGQVNATVDRAYGALRQATNVYTDAVRIQGQAVSWKDQLQTRFRACAYLGFTLGLLLGITSLLHTMVAFRRTVRQVKLARLAHRFYSPADKGLTDAAAGGMLADPESIVNRSLAVNISNVVFFTGVLLSIAIVQLYAVGVALSVGLAVISHPWLWTWFVPRYYMILVGIVVVIVLNKLIMVTYLGDLYLSNGDRIVRPGGYLAFLVIASAANLIIGLLLAVIRIALLLVTTILAVGRTDITIFTYFKILDVPHQAFLAGVHLYDAMAHFDDPVYTPGERGRAWRNWRKLRAVVKHVKTKDLKRLVNDSGDSESGSDGKASRAGSTTPALPVPSPPSRRSMA